MRTKTPLQEKTPFAINPEPVEASTTARAGLSIFSRAFRSLGIPALCEQFLHIKQRSRGYTEAQQLESLVLLHIDGGDCMEDIEVLREDTGIPKMLGYTPPGTRCLGDFLESFHDQRLVEKAREQAKQAQLLAFIPEETPALEGLAQVQRKMARACSAKGACETRATIDQDATLIECHKKSAMWTYEGTRGYQPMVAAWAEKRLIMSDEFRDGNVPALLAPLSCAKAAFAALPETVKEYFFRGDSACHESKLVNWLRDEQREDGPKGFIGFAVSARMSADLRAALCAIKEQQWLTIAKEADGTLRQWAEVDFVPGEKVEKKDIVPLRYIGLRLLKAQGDIFADGSDRHHHAILTNRDEDGAVLLQWQRDKAGTIEHVHDELKNGLGAGKLPSAKFGANAAWFRIACIAYNIMETVRAACPDEELRTAKAKRVRRRLINVPGRFSRDRRKLTLNLNASRTWIKQLIKVFDTFPLRTQATF
jgi:hypothetical protein